MAQQYYAAGGACHFSQVRYLENMSPESKLAPGAIFPHITRKNADTNVGECCQFFANYFFHKFGTEICFVSMVVTVWIRQDLWGSIYALFLLILMIISFRSRRHLARIWKPYTIILAVIWVLQYAFVLGLPPTLCYNYNWPTVFQFLRRPDDDNSEIPFECRLSRFVRFMFLPERPQFYSTNHRSSGETAYESEPWTHSRFLSTVLAACQCAFSTTKSEKNGFAMQDLMKIHLLIRFNFLLSRFLTFF